MLVTTTRLALGAAFERNSFGASFCSVYPDTLRAAFLATLAPMPLARILRPSHSRLLKTFYLCAPYQGTALVRPTMEEHTPTLKCQPEHVPGDAHWETLSRILGKSAKELKALPDFELDKLIEAHSHKRLIYSNTIRGKIPRGNPLLALGRLIDHTAILARFNKVFG